MSDFGPKYQNMPQAKIRGPTDWEVRLEARLMTASIVSTWEGNGLSTTASQAAAARSLAATYIHTLAKKGG